MSGFGSGLLRRIAGKRISEAIATENQGFKTAAERRDNRTLTDH